MRWFPIALFLFILCSECVAIPLSTDEDTSTKVAESQVNKLGNNLQNLDFIFHFLSDKFVGEENRDMKVFESGNDPSKESKKLKESLGSTSIGNGKTVDVKRIGNEGVVKQDIEDSEGPSSRQRLLVPIVKGSYGRQNKVYWTDEELGAAADVVAKNNDGNQAVPPTSTRTRLLVVPKGEELNERQNEVNWTGEELKKAAAVLSKVNAQYGGKKRRDSTGPKPN